MIITLHILVFKIFKMHIKSYSMQNILKRKYNILYTSSFGTLKGGGQRSTYLLIKFLNKDNFKPFLTVPEKGDFSEEIDKLGIKTFITSSPRIKSLNLIAIVKALFSFWYIIHKEHIDIIHTESPRQTFYIGIIAKVLKVPLIMHLRVDDSYIQLDKLLYKLCSCFIAVSNSVVNRFKSIDKRNKVIVVYNAVDLNVFIPSINYKQSGALRVCYFGRIDRRKNIETLIKAVKYIDKTKVNLIINGDGYKNYWEELKILSFDSNITFNNYKKEVINEIKQADLIVLPSLYGEGLSRIIIEAMAMGKTVIASDTPPNREALGDEFKGFLFPPGNDKILSKIIKNIVNNRKILIDNSKKCRKRAEQCFDVLKNTKEIEKIYFQILQNKRK